MNSRKYSNDFSWPYMEDIRLLNEELQLEGDSRKYLNDFSWSCMEDTRLSDEELQLEENDDFPIEIPSKVADKKFISFPDVEKVVESDDEWDNCGKWMILFLTAGSDLQDRAWIKLKKLVKDGTLLMVKSSTIKTKDNHGAILCYTHPEKCKIKIAAEAIQRTIGIEYSMCYKKNSERRKMKVMSCVCEKHVYSYQYMYTPTGKLYETDELLRWILIKDDDIQKETTELEKPNVSSDESGIAFPPKMEQKNSHTLKVFDFFDAISGYWLVRCDKQAKNGVSEAKEILKAAQKLFEDIVLPEVEESAIHEKSVVLKFYIKKHDNDNDIIKYASKLRRSVIFTHPMYFHRYSEKTGKFHCTFMYTAENELFGRIVLNSFSFAPIWKVLPLPFDSYIMHH